MSKTSAIADMRGLIGPFFDEDHDRALEIKKTILGKVKSFFYSPANQRLVENSLSVWEPDIDNYLNQKAQGESIDKVQVHHTYLALEGIINLISLATE